MEYFELDQSMDDIHKDDLECSISAFKFCMRHNSREDAAEYLESVDCLTFEQRGFTSLDDYKESFINGDFNLQVFKQLEPVEGR